jgi:hypothetical protein
MEECVVCWNEIPEDTESSLQVSKVVVKILKEELGVSVDGSELSICPDCIRNFFADYMI